MTAILAIDPGKTTGVALVKDGVVLYASDLSLQEIDRLTSVAFLASVIVIEDIPVQAGGGLSRELELVNRRLRTMFPDALTIKPGVWKPVMKGTPVPDNLSSLHQKDAFLIAEYVRTRGKL